MVKIIFEENRLKSTLRRNFIIKKYGTYYWFLLKLRLNFQCPLVQTDMGILICPHFYWTIIFERQVTKNKATKQFTPLLLCTKLITYIYKSELRSFSNIHKKFFNNIGIKFDDLKLKMIKISETSINHVWEKGLQRHI